MQTRSVFILLGLLSFGAATLFLGCTADTPSAPNIPLTPAQQAQSFRVVAIGNSLTAGYINSGLLYDGQIAGFPNLLTQSVFPVPATLPPQIPPTAPGSYLAMPLVAGSPSARGFGAPNSQGIPQSSMYVAASGAIVTDDVLDPTALLLNAEWPLPYDNLGVPGALTADVVSAIDAGSSVSGANAFFDLILRNSVLPPFDTTQIDQLTSLSMNEAIVRPELPSPSL